LLANSRLPYAADQMAIWPISPRVNSPKNNDPGILEPIAVDVQARRPGTGGSLITRANSTGCLSERPARTFAVSPQTRQTLKTTQSFPGGSTTNWAEIRGGQSSPEITDGRCFAGCFSNMTS